MRYERAMESRVTRTRLWAAIANSDINQSADTVVQQSDQYPRQLAKCKSILGNRGSHKWTVWGLSIEFSRGYILNKHCLAMCTTWSVRKGLGIMMS